MGLILSIFAALGGSVAGAAVRAGITVVDQQLAKRASEGSEPMMINGSLVGGVAAVERRRRFRLRLPAVGRPRRAVTATTRPEARHRLRRH